ncbi:MAG TPA: cytochrome c [Woeseiaceae bacterium]
MLVFSACAQVTGPPSLPDTVPSANLLATSASVRDGVYSTEQSRRGEAHYLEHCKRCHLRDLSGDYGEDAPALVGEEFLSNWANWTLGDLFDFMQTEMPPKRQDRRDLTADTYADILAFILERNGFPAGAAELPPGFEPLSEIGMGSSP